MIMFSAAPVQAFAASPAAPDTCEVFLGGVSQGSFSFNNAILQMSPSTGDEIVLKDTIDITGDLSLETKSTFTLDLAGFDLNISGSLILYDGIFPSYTVLIVTDSTASSFSYGTGSLNIAGDVLATDRDPISIGLDNCAVISSGAFITIEGKVDTTGNGVAVYDFGLVEILGGINAGGGGIYAANSGNVLVGTMTAPAAVTVAGFAIILKMASTTVWGDVNAFVNTGISAGWAIAAMNSSSCSVSGKVTSAFSGVYADGFSMVSVDGSVSTPAASGESGVQAYSNSQVAIGGSVIATDGVGVIAYDGAEVTIDGSISANNTYILFYDENTWVDLPKTAADFVTPSTKPPYLTYTDFIVNANASYVWVGNYYTPDSASPPSGQASIPSTGDNAGLLAAGSAIALLLAGLLLTTYAAYAGRRKKHRI
jgi:hypothetical protein